MRVELKFYVATVAAASSTKGQRARLRLRSYGLLAHNKAAASKIANF